MINANTVNGSQQKSKSALRQLTGSSQKNADDPIEMLETCHQKVHRMLALLRKLRIYLESTSCDEQARQAALDIMRYFDSAAPLHHQDEELHIFPPLLNCQQPLIDVFVKRLLSEHRIMEDTWICIRSDLDRIAKLEGDQRFMFSDATRTAMDQFAAIYGSHIELEETVVYLAARDLLSSEANQLAMREMMHRRGVN